MNATKVGQRYEMSGMVQRYSPAQTLAEKMREIVETADMATIRRWAVQRNCPAGTGTLPNGHEVHFLASAYLQAGGAWPQIWIDAVQYDADGKVQPLGGARFSWKREDDGEAARLLEYLRRQDAQQEKDNHP